MKKYRQNILLAVFLLLSLLAIPSVAAGSPAILMAGQNEPVGTVTAYTNSEGILVVRYDITADGWSLVSTELQVAGNAADIPLKNGNPVVGKFTYKRTYDPYVTTDSYTTIAVTTGSTYVIAAHAVVANKDTSQLLEVIDVSLPTCAEFELDHPGLINPTYFDVLVTGGLLADEAPYPGWCAQAGVTINLPSDPDYEHYTAMAYSSYDEDLYGLVAASANTNFNGDNFARVNWIINEHYLEKGYSSNDIQRAIWSYISDPTKSVSYPFSDDDYLQIVEDAKSHTDFVPDYSQNIAVVLVPVVDCTAEPLTLVNYQLTFIEVGVSSLTEEEDQYIMETAWGDGLDFSGANWATYFEYTA